MFCLFGRVCQFLRWSIQSNGYLWVGGWLVVEQQQKKFSLFSLLKVCRQTSVNKGGRFGDLHARAGVCTNRVWSSGRSKKKKKKMKKIIDQIYVSTFWKQTFWTGACQRLTGNWGGQKIDFKVDNKNCWWQMENAWVGDQQWERERDVVTASAGGRQQVRWDSQKP